MHANTQMLSFAAGQQQEKASEPPAAKERRGKAKAASKKSVMTPFSPALTRGRSAAKSSEAVAKGARPKRGASKPAAPGKTAKRAKRAERATGSGKKPVAATSGRKKGKGAAKPPKSGAAERRSSRARKAAGADKEAGEDSDSDSDFGSELDRLIDEAKAGLYGGSGGGEGNEGEGEGAEGDSEGEAGGAESYDYEPESVEEGDSDDDETYDSEEEEGDYDTDAADDASSSEEDEPAAVPKRVRAARPALPRHGAGALPPGVEAALAAGAPELDMIHFGAVSALEADEHERGVFRAVWNTGLSKRVTFDVARNDPTLKELLIDLLYAVADAD